MTDHWQVIEDALESERIAFVTFNASQQSVEAIDAALDFVREQRRVPTGELLPCPFCGWPDPSWHVERHAYDWIDYAVHCGNCDAESVMAKTKEDAATAWNRRVPTARTPQEGRYVPVEDGEIDPIEWGIVVAYGGRVLRFLGEGGAGLSAKLPDGYRLCRWQEGDTPQGQPLYSHRNGESDEPTEPGWYWFDGYLGYKINGKYPKLNRPVLVTVDTEDRDGAFWYGADDDATYACADGWLHGQWWGPINPPWDTQPTDAAKDDAQGKDTP